MRAELFCQNAEKLFEQLGIFACAAQPSAKCGGRLFRKRICGNCAYGGEGGVRGAKFASAKGVKGGKEQRAGQRNCEKVEQKAR